MQPLLRGNIRLAATILLIREGDGGPEVFMMKRPGGVDFPDLHVFPGGKVDEGDFAPELVSGLTPAVADRLLGIEAGGLRYWVAAIRECFEECGVLLAYRDGSLIRWADENEIERFNGYRQRLIDGDLRMLDVCRLENIRLAADRVLYFSRAASTPASSLPRCRTTSAPSPMPGRRRTTSGCVPVTPSPPMPKDTGR